MCHSAPCLREVKGIPASIEQSAIAQTERKRKLIDALLQLVNSPYLEVLEQVAAGLAEELKRGALAE